MSSTPPNPTTTHNATELLDLVRRCIDTNTPLADYGVAQAGLGNPPPDNAVRLTQAGGVIEHYERDLSVRAAAGITLGDLQRALRSSNQFVPIDADDDLTLGEIINHNVYNALRVGYGSIRDLLLGLHYVDGLGRDIHVGGRTVKNVAGYDVTRLMVGSLGELGVVHEATLRTYAIPEQVLAIDVRTDDPGRLDALLPQWLLADAAPARLHMSNLTGEWFIRVGFHGRSTACAAQLKSLETLLDAAGGFHIVGSGYTTLADDLAELALRRSWRRGAAALVKIVVPPAHTGGICGTLEEWAQSQDLPLTLAALPAHGCLFAGGALDAAAAAGLDGQINTMLAEAAGFRAWYARPHGGENIRPFAPDQPDWALLRKLKKTMDPHNIFNRGRFLAAEGVEETK